MERTEIVAHLIHVEHDDQTFITQLVDGNEALFDGNGSNVHAQVRATVAVNPSIKLMLSEFTPHSRGDSALMFPSCLMNSQRTKVVSIVLVPYSCKPIFTLLHIPNKSKIRLLRYANKCDEISGAGRRATPPYSIIPTRYFQVQPGNHPGLRRCGHSDPNTDYRMGQA